VRKNREKSDEVDLQSREAENRGAEDEERKGRLMVTGWQNRRKGGRGRKRNSHQTASKGEHDPPGGSLTV